jgi:hypothetical protein
MLLMLFRRRAHYDRLLEFVRRLAAIEVCTDEHKALECSPDFRPLCISHDWGVDADLVAEARRLIAEIDAP